MNFNWENLLEEQCPSCGWQMIQRGDFWYCDQHKQEFKISNERFVSLQREMQEKRDFSFPEF